MNRKSLILIGLFIVVLVTAASFALPLSRATNCGGNSAALAAVSDYALQTQVWIGDSPDHVLKILAITPEQKKELIPLAHNHWIPEARFLVSTAALSDQEGQSRKIIVVCDTPYRNVPRNWLRLAPPSYAAGFSDGSIGLITAAQFQALDRPSFRYLDELCTTN